MSKHFIAVAACDTIPNGKFIRVSVEGRGVILAHVAGPGQSFALAGGMVAQKINRGAAGQVIALAAQGLQGKIQAD